VIEDTYTKTITLTRLTAEVLAAATPTASMTPNYQPAGAANMMVRLRGGSSGGNITVIGQVGGAPDTEVISLASGDTGQQGTKLFTTVGSFTLSGISDGTVEVTAVRSSGEPYTRELIVSTIMGRIKARKGYLRMIATGRDPVSDYVMACMGADEIKEERFVYTDGKKYEITFVSPVAQLGNVNCDLHYVETSEGP